MHAPHPTRRSFLRAGAALPACLAPAFGQDVGASRASRAAAEAWERAQLVGQPLLLLVVPDDARRRAAAADLWTRVLGALPDDGFLDLGLCEVHAGTLAALGRDLDQRADVAALLCEPRDGALRRFELGDRLRPSSSAPTVRWAARWASALGELVLPDSRALERRCADAARDAPPDDLDPLLREVVHARRAFIRQRAAPPRTSAARDEWARVLAHQVRARLVAGGPSGARWVDERRAAPAPIPGALGCAGLPCGTGHVPLPARRLLELYTR
jgi:hypothetical protein